MGIVEAMNFGNDPNYLVLNVPLCRNIFGMGGDVFLTGMPFMKKNHATGSTASKRSSLGSTTPLVPQLPDKFLGFNHAIIPEVPHRFFGFIHH